MSPLSCVFAGLGSRFPRVSGDEPSSRLTLPSETMFSPRERG